MKPAAPGPNNGQYILLGLFWGTQTLPPPYHKLCCSPSLGYKLTNTDYIDYIVCQWALGTTPMYWFNIDLATMKCVR